MAYEIRPPQLQRGTFWTAYGDLAESGPSGSVDHHSRATVQGVVAGAEVKEAQRIATQAKLDQALASSFHRVASEHAQRYEDQRGHAHTEGGHAPTGPGALQTWGVAHEEPDALKWGLKSPSKSITDRVAYVSNLMAQADYARLAGATLAALDIVKVAEEDEILVPSDSRRNHLQVRRVQAIRKIGSGKKQ